MKKNTAYFEPEDTKSRLKTEILVRKKYPSISEKELKSTINDLKRFSRVVARMAKEPQFRVYFKKSKKEKIIWQKVYEFRLNQFRKIPRPGKAIPIGEALRPLGKVIEKDEKR